MKTPTRSPPPGGHFQSLPTLDDTGLKSPVGIFLSPHPPTPSTYRSIHETGSFDRPDSSRQDDKPYAKSPKSPNTRAQERDRFVATPTDFAMDYGKHPNSGPFDSSNGKFREQTTKAAGFICSCICSTGNASTCMVAVTDCKWSVFSRWIGIHHEHSSGNWNRASDP